MLYTFLPFLTKIEIDKGLKQERMTIRATFKCLQYKTTSKSTIKGYKYERERIYSPNFVRLVVGVETNNYMGFRICFERSFICDHSRCCSSIDSILKMVGHFSSYRKI